MEYVKWILEITVAFFAVLGLYGTIQWFLRHLFGSEHLLLAVKIATRQDAERAEELVRDALFGVLSWSSRRVVILTDLEWVRHSNVEQVAKRYGIACICAEDETS